MTSVQERHSEVSVVEFTLVVKIGVFWHKTTDFRCSFCYTYLSTSFFRNVMSKNVGWRHMLARDVKWHAGVLTMS